MQPQGDENIIGVVSNRKKEQERQHHQHLVHGREDHQQQQQQKQQPPLLFPSIIIKRKGSRTTLMKEITKMTTSATTRKTGPSSPKSATATKKETDDSASDNLNTPLLAASAGGDETTTEPSKKVSTGSQNTSNQQQQQEETEEREDAASPSSRTTSHGLPSTLGRLAALGSPFPNSDEEIGLIGNFLNRGAAVGLLLWALSLAFVFWTCPADSYERLQGPERSVSLLVWVLLFVTNGSRMLPLLFQDYSTVFGTGVITASCSVQFIALITVGCMIIFPTPVLVDEVTNRRVLMLRWAAWTPLSFIMTFLTEGMDLPNNMTEQRKAAKIAWAHGFSVAASAAAGLLFPFCKTLTTWLVVFVISCILFMSIYVRLYQRWRRLKDTPVGQSVEDQEYYDRVRLSFRLLGACAFMWTVLVISFTLGCMADHYGTPGTIWTNPALPTIIESIFEIGSKVWYLILVIDIHEVVFDESSRAIRRLEEMRDMMNVVWETSSDIIAMCVRTDNTIHAVVSPTFLSIFRDPNDDDDDDDFDNAMSSAAAENDDDDDFSDMDEARDFVAIVFEIPYETDNNEDNQEQGSQKHRIFALNMNEPFKRFDLAENERLLDFYIDRDPDSVDQRNISSMVELFRDAWRHDNKESLVIQGLEGKFSYGSSNAAAGAGDNMSETSSQYSSSQNHPSSNSNKDAIQYEAKITKLASDAIVIVLRDISERFQRFEAEKQLVMEMTERKKDAEANRFTRHEVKNGLLAAIDLVDSLKESLGADLSGHLRTAATTTSAGGGGAASSSSTAGGGGSTTSGKNTEPLQSAMRSSFRNRREAQLRAPSTRTILELDQTLHEVLDTVMAEAMARDVVHGVYELKEEEVDVRQILARRETANEVRFPFLVNPSPFPRLLLDPQLLRYVHRNAVSNAIKYGRSAGKVTTDIHYDSIREELRVSVINEPGRGHERLVELSQGDVDKIFFAGTRLEANVGDMPSEEGSFVTSSAGDGAWITQKCARVLGGHCFIKFEERRTIFSLYCPSKTWSKVPDVINVTEVPTIFALPANTWGVAIDDSGIQRKLLNRFLALAGVTEQRRIVLGSNSKEMLGFTNYLGNLIRENPSDKFLVIVDENLDILDGGMHQQTVSGSMCIKVLREELEEADEERLLSLVRSANDSSEDVTMYKERAHGFLPKAPIQKDKVLDLIEPWWNERFPNDTSARVRLDPDYDSEFLSFAISLEDLMETIEVVDDRISESTENEATLKQNWPGIREKLHILKGDLKTMKQTSLVRKIIEKMEQLRGEKAPEDLSSRWKKIRNLIISMRC